MENKKATHSSILAWKIPWTEEPGGLQSVGLQKSRTRLKQLSRSAQYIHYLEGNQGILSLPALNSSESESEVLSCVQLFAAPWTVAHQAPPSMEFSRQEYWSGLPFPSPRDLPHPGIEPRPPALWADALPSEPPGNP